MWHVEYLIRSSSSHTLCSEMNYPGRKKLRQFFPVGFADLCCALVNQIAIDSSNASALVEPITL